MNRVHEIGIQLEMKQLKYSNDCIALVGFGRRLTMIDNERIFFDKRIYL